MRIRLTIIVLIAILVPFADYLSAQESLTVQSRNRQSSQARKYFIDGSRYYLKDDFKNAIGPYSIALELEKKQPTLDKTMWRVLVGNLGMAYWAIGDLKMAMEIFDYGISEDNTYPMHYYFMAYVYAKKNDPGNVAMYLKRAFEYKDNVIIGEKMPDPRVDSSFQRFMQNDLFLATLLEIEQVSNTYPSLARANQGTDREEANNFTNSTGSTTSAEKGEAKISDDSKSQLLATFATQIRAKIVRFIVLPPGVPANAEVIYNLTLLPDGNVLRIQKVSGTGHTPYEASVLRAIQKAGPLPVPDDPELFKNFRIAQLVFRPGTAETPSISPIDIASQITKAPSATPAQYFDSGIAYPPSARANGLEGSVTIRVLVKADGTLGESKIFKSSGIDELDAAALDGVQKWRFVPARTEAGESFPGWVEIPVRFSLRTPERKSAPPTTDELDSYIEARKKAREAPQLEARVPSFDSSKGGGIFQIVRMSSDTAEFTIFHRNKDLDRDTSELVEVRKDHHADIRVAVVRKMIAIIREIEQGDFIWTSTQLGRNIYLSARPKDNAGLEDFMMREFFPDTRQSNRPSQNSAQINSTTEQTITPNLTTSQSLQEIARLETQITTELDQYQKYPRRKFIGARTSEFRFAKYIEKLFAKLLRVAEELPGDFYSNQSYRSVQVTISIRADGSVEKTEINRSSGNVVVDALIPKLVDLAAPFEPFTEEITRDTDILSITRTLQIREPRSAPSAGDKPGAAALKSQPVGDQIDGSVEQRF